MSSVIVIGGGPAGVSAALRARELGANVALVERDHLGGTCTNDGCVPTRVLAHAARLAREAEQFAAYGLAEYQPQIDLGALMDKTHNIVSEIHTKKGLAATLAAAGVQLYAGLGPAQFINPHTLRLGDGRELYGDRFILCAGGRARQLSFPGSELALTHGDIWRMRTAPASLAIVGGAATGCQMASIFAAFGTRVTLLERNTRLLAAEDDLVGELVTGAFERRGIKIIRSIRGVEKIERDGRDLRLYYRIGDELLSLTTEAVILAAGWIGNVESLNLEAAGVAHERNFIGVDDYLRTSAEHIFAAGDITGRMMLVQSGSFDARLAAENAVLGLGPRYRHAIVPHGGFTDPEYGSVGMTEKQAQAAGLDYVTGVVPYIHLDRAVIDGRTEGACKLVVGRETHRILGAHIVGEQALESIQLAAAGMASDMWVEQLAELELAYPTYTAVLGLAARQVVRKLGVMALSAQWLELGLGHGEWESASGPFSGPAGLTGGAGLGG